MNADDTGAVHGGVGRDGILHVLWIDGRPVLPEVKKTCPRPTSTRRPSLSCRDGAFCQHLGGSRKWRVGCGAVKCGYSRQTMGEGDWWLCRDCQSLNNLSARKCYSCGKRKPKRAVRASDYLGYQPVMSWDGKISMRPVASAGSEDAGTKVPPIRDPIPRNTLAVAPRPPKGARIVYRDVAPVQIWRAAPRIPGPPVLPVTGPPVPPPAPGVPAPLSRPMPFVPVTDVRRMIAVGLAPPSGVARTADPEPAEPETNQAQEETEPWPHWYERLDVPTPHADRLRTAYAPSTNGRDDAGHTIGHQNGSPRRHVTNGRPSGDAGS